MAYTITNTYALDPSYAGASLRCQLVQYSAGSQVNSGSPISAGFFEQAGGQGLFDHALSATDDFVGWAHIYDNAAPTVILVSFPINPRELEYADARLTALPGMVWGNSVRTLSSFGSLVADVAAAVWANVTRTLTSGGGATADEVAAAVWTYVAGIGRTLTAFGANSLVEFTYTLTVTNTSQAIPDARIRITTDQPGSNTVWVGTTDSFGVARDSYGNKPRLEAGTYYIWRSKFSYIFNDPDTEVVS